MQAVPDQPGSVYYSALGNPVRAFVTPTNVVYLTLGQDGFPADESVYTTDAATFNAAYSTTLPSSSTT
jgi:hypothetical protein